MSKDLSGVGWSAWTGAASDGLPDAVLRTDGDARYARLGLLGRGGMGEVELSHDARLVRDVAIKRVAPGAPAGAAALLVHEARLTAHLQHPGIVAVHDLGVDDDGEPWVAMALVRGQTLADALAASIGPTARLHWVRHLLGVCEAVAFAHRAGVVHRDLKPANVFVGDLGQTQVGDWGLAEVLPGHGWEQVLGERPPPGSSGTPAYMAPEQARGAAPDPRADVYSLGAVLHELLVGSPPSEGVALDGPVELVAIAAKATRLAPTERYADAAELSADLERWLEGRRVTAYAYSPWDLALRLAAAWRAPLAVGAVAAVLLGVGGAWSYVATLHERDRAVLAEAATRAALVEADHNLAAALVAQALEVWAGGAVGEAEVLAAHALARGGGPMARGLLAGLAAETHPRLGRDLPLPGVCDVRRLSPDGAWLFCGGETGGGLYAVGETSPRWPAPDAVVDAVFLSSAVVAVGLATPDGRGEVRRLEVATGAPWGPSVPIGSPRRFDLVSEPGRGTLRNGYDLLLLDGSDAMTLRRCDGVRTIQGAALVAHGQRLVVVCSDGRLELSDAPFQDIEEVTTPLADGPPSAELIVALPEGDLLVAGSKGALYRLTLDGALLWTQDALVGPVTSMCLSPDGARAVASTDRGAPVVIDTGSGRVLAYLPAHALGPCIIDAAGDVHTVSSRIQQWSVTPGPPASYQHDSGLSWVGERDGAVFATAGDGTLVRWDATGRSTVVQGGQRPAKGGAFLPDGEVVFVGLGIPGLGRLPPTSDGVSWIPAPGERASRRVGALASGWVWTASHGRGLALWNSTDPRWLMLGLDAPVTFAEGWTLPDGSAAVLADDGGGVWWLADGDPPSLTPWRDEADALALAADPGGDVVLLAGRGFVRAVVRANGVERWRTELDTVAVDLTASADGRFVAVAGLDGAARLLSADDGRLLAVMPGHAERVGAVAFTDDSRWLLTAGWDGRVRRWATEVDVSPAQAEAVWGVGLQAALGSL